MGGERRHHCTASAPSNVSEGVELQAFVPWGLPTRVISLNNFSLSQVSFKDIKAGNFFCDGMLPLRFLYHLFFRFLCSSYIGFEILYSLLRFISELAEAKISLATCKAKVSCL